MTPSLISGYPIFAVSAAIRISHIIANSSPPPKAMPFIAAIMGFLSLGTILNHYLSNISSKICFCKFNSLSSLMFAPVAKELDPYFPVKMITLIYSFFSRVNNVSFSSFISGKDKNVN